MAARLEVRYRQRHAAIPTSFDYGDWTNFLGYKHTVTALLSRLREQCTNIPIDDVSCATPWAERRTLASVRSHRRRHAP